MTDADTSGSPACPAIAPATAGSTACSCRTAAPSVARLLGYLLGARHPAAVVGVDVVAHHVDRVVLLDVRTHRHAGLVERRKQQQIRHALGHGLDQDLAEPFGQLFHLIQRHVPTLPSVAPLPFAASTRSSPSPGG